jgi:hypothetical protein
MRPDIWGEIIRELFAAVSRRASFESSSQDFQTA